jgi:hypothetical protein
MTSVLHDYSSYKEARSSSQPYINCKVSKISEGYKAADLNDRPKLFLSFSLSISSVDSTDDGKLGYGFTSADELEEVDIGPGDKPRPTFISKKSNPCLQELMIALLKEYADCFAWDYTEMPGLVSHPIYKNINRAIIYAPGSSHAYIQQIIKISQHMSRITLI